MATLRPNAFSSYELTEREEREGALLNINQKMVLYNRLSQYAHEKLNLKYDPANAFKFAQEEAELHGQILLLQNILDESEIAEKQLSLELKEAAKSNPQE